jgi:TonB family protein
VTRNRLLIAALSAVWLILVGISVWTRFPITRHQKVTTEFTKFRKLLVALDVPERAYAAQFAELTKTSHGVDYRTIYQGIDLDTIEGIQTARQRVTVFATQTEKCVAINEQLWRQIKKIVDQSDLDQPFEGLLKDKLSLDESDVYPKYRALIPAAREYAEAVTHYLDFNEHYLGQFKRTGGTLTFSNPRVPQDLTKAQLALAAAQVHYESAARAAFQNRGNTLKFVEAAVRDLQKEMTPGKDVRQETDPDQSAPKPSTQTAEPGTAPASPDSPARVDPKHPLRIGEEFYPLESRMNVEEGTCLLRLQVDSEGYIRATQLLSPTGFSRLNAACLSSTNSGRLIPATVAGKPVASWFVFRVSWRLSGATFAERPRIRDDYQLKVGPDYYPPLSRKLHQEGDCIVHVSIKKDGPPSTVTLSKSAGYDPLDQGCLAAIKEAQFVAARQNEDIIPSSTDIDIAWRLP